MEIFCALMGVLYAYSWHPYLPLALILLILMRRRYMYILAFIMAFLWALLHQSWVLPATLPTGTDPSQVILQGQVFSKPDIAKGRTRFQFAVNQVNGKKQSFIALLSWYQKAPTLQLGDNWQLIVRLKKPRNLQNPGAFNYEQSLQAKHIAWIGYVRSGSILATKPSRSIALHHKQWREKWGKQLDALSADATASGIIQALTLGLTGNISQENWALFRRTGTTHLMVISGAHIGLVAGLMFGLIHWLWRRSYKACLYWPAPKVASVFSIVSAFLYAIIAGFAVPAQRSLLACSFAFFRFLGNQRFSGWQGWRYGLLFALLFEPHAVLLPGFYLSFTAVAILIVVHQRWSAKGWLQQTLIAQCACLIGLIPLTLYWFSYASLSGFFANLIAIPLVGFLLVPFSLLTLLLINTDIAWISMAICTLLIQCLMKILTVIDKVSFINLDYSFYQVLLPLGLLASMFCYVLLPLRVVLLPGCLLALCACFPALSKVKTGEAHIRVFDVGQGLAVLVQTARHSLLYDAGDAFPGGSDMGKMAILPALRVLGIKHLDKIVISHQDKDHYGGLQSVEPLLTGDLLVNAPAFYQKGLSCHEYPPWNWEGVRFQFLAINNHFNDKNNTSCVLKVSAGNRHMLLTGDIEKSAESWLARIYPEELQSDVLLLAHHGSKTSSSPLFIQQVAPTYAIASTGFENRYHFPHKATLETCEKRHIPFYNTAQTGMISVLLSDNSVKISKYRGSSVGKNNENDSR